MRKTMLTILSLLVVLPGALLLATPAMAGHDDHGDHGEKGDWEFGPYGGFGWLDNYGTLHPDNGSLWGGRVGYFFTPALSLEGSFQRLTSEIETGEDFYITSERLNVLWSFRPGASFRLTSLRAAYRP